MTDALRVPIQLKTRTTAEWAAQGSTILLRGQIGVEVDNVTGAIIRFAIGDGKTAWSAFLDPTDFFTKGSGSGGGSTGPANVPQIGAAPVIYWTDQNWIIFLELPGARGKTALQGEVKLENLVVVPNFSLVVPIGRQTQLLMPRLAFDVNVTYRWRNLYRGGGSSGWSAFSAASVAYADSSVPENVPFSEFAGFNPDPNDGSLT